MDGNKGRTLFAAGDGIAHALANGVISKSKILLIAINAGMVVFIGDVPDRLSLRELTGDLPTPVK